MASDEEIAEVRKWALFTTRRVLNSARAKEKIREFIEGKTETTNITLDLRLDKSLRHALTDPSKRAVWAHEKS